MKPQLRRKQNITGSGAPLRKPIRRSSAALARLGMAFAFLAGVGSSPALAQSADWNTAATAGGSWGIPTNWQGGIVPSGVANTAGFALDFLAGSTVTLDGDRLIGTILSSSATPWSIDAGSGGTLTVAGITV